MGKSEGEREKDVKPPMGKVEGLRGDPEISSPAPEEDPARVGGGPESNADRFKKRFKELVDDYDPKAGTTVTQVFQQWLDRLGKVADEVLGKPTPRRNRKRQMPKYVDEEVWGAIKQRRQLWGKVRDAVNRGASAETREEAWKQYCGSVREGKDMIRRKRAESWSSYCDKLNQLWYSDPKKFWGEVTRLRSKGTAGFGSMRVGDAMVHPGDPGYIRAWKEYYEKLGGERSTLPVWEEVHAFRKEVRRGKICMEIPKARRLG